MSGPGHVRQPSRWPAPWVRGLGMRPARPRRSWEEQLALVLLARFSDVDGDGTHEAESALEIPDCSYWYAGRASEAYGKAITVWRPEFEDRNAPSGGLCPFDTGGLASGRILGDPPFGDNADRLAYFRSADLPLAGWAAAVLTDVTERWLTLVEYVRGERPAVANRLTQHPHNESRAWAWEARIEKTDVTAVAISLQRLALTYDDRQALGAWIGASAARWSTSEARALGMRLRDAAVHDDPFMDTTAYLIACIEA